MKFHPLLLPALLALTACQQQPDQVRREEFERLRAKVAELEEEVAAARDAKVEPAPAEQSIPQERYRLIGAAFQNEPDLRYSSKEDCDAAKATLLSDWQAEDERNRGRGVVFTSRPTPSCLPL